MVEDWKVVWKIGRWKLGKIGRLEDWKRCLMHYTIAYDITDDKRRNKVAKILKDFGQRVQYSVFECNIDKRAYLRLHDRLEKAMDMDEDTITFYHICAACEKQIERIGVVKSLDNSTYIV